MNRSSNLINWHIFNSLFQALSLARSKDAGTGGARWQPPHRLAVSHHTAWRFFVAEMPWLSWWGMNFGLTQSTKTHVISLFFANWVVLIQKGSREGSGRVPRVGWILNALHLYTQYYSDDSIRTPKVRDCTLQWLGDRKIAQPSQRSAGVNR